MIWLNSATWETIQREFWQCPGKLAFHKKPKWLLHVKQINLYEHRFNEFSWGINDIADIQVALLFTPWDWSRALWPIIEGNISNKHSKWQFEDSARVSNERSQASNMEMLRIQGPEFRKKMTKSERAEAVRSLVAELPITDCFTALKTPWNINELKMSRRCPTCPQWEAVECSPSFQ